MAEQLIGKVTHYFNKPQVAAIEITEGQLNVGDTIHIVGHTSDSIGIKVIEHAREHDKVYCVTPD